MRRRSEVWLSAAVLTALLALGGCTGGSRPARSASTAGGSVSTTPLPSSMTTTSRPSSTTMASGPVTFEPDGIAFWTVEQGLLVGTNTTPACRAGSEPCASGLIERTADGGSTWQVVDEVPGPVNAVSIAGANVAWVTVARCGPGSPNACGSSIILKTTDGGSTWSEVLSRTSVTSIAPVSGTIAWAVAGASGAAFPLGTSLVRSEDGGMSWHPAQDPCRGVSNVDLWSVRFGGVDDGWVICTSEPATDMQPKALFSTTDGGVSWQLRSDTCLFTATGQSAASVGSLPCVGYLPGMSFLPDGHGWMWMDRGVLSSTSDDGQTWSGIGQGVVIADENIVMSASLVSDDVGEAIVWQANAQYVGLFSTTDGGKTWRLRHRWPPA